MVRLTPLGKLVVGLLAATLLYGIASLLLPFFSSGAFPSLPALPLGEETSGKKAVEITVFVTSFDRDSVTVVETLRALALEARYRGRFVMKIVNINKEPERAQEAGVTVTPSILVEGDLFEGKKDAQWFREQIDARS